MTDRKTQVTGDWAEGKTYTATISDRNVGHGFVDPRFSAAEALRVALDQQALVAANPGLFDVVEIENMAPLSFTIWPIDAEAAGDAIHVFDEDGLFNLNNGWTWVEAGEIAGSNAGSLANSLAGNTGSDTGGFAVIDDAALAVEARKSLAANAAAVTAGIMTQTVREELDRRIFDNPNSWVTVPDDADLDGVLTDAAIAVPIVLAGSRRIAFKALGACLNDGPGDGTHFIDPDDNNWCRTCDTGECPDCEEPTFWFEPDGWYHHIDATKTCFLIQTCDDPTAVAKAEAREAFHAAVTAFIDAGNALVNAWDADGFNADESYPLPDRLAPPMSFDEWFAELSEHYARIEA